MAQRFSPAWLTAVAFGEVLKSLAEHWHPRAAPFASKDRVILFEAARKSGAERAPVSKLQ